MSLAYDYSYKEWRLTHPLAKPEIKPQPKVSPTTLRKTIRKTQEPAKKAYDWKTDPRRYTYAGGHNAWKYDTHSKSWHRLERR